MVTQSMQLLGFGGGCISNLGAKCFRNHSCHLTSFWMASACSQHAISRWLSILRVEAVFHDRSRGEEYYVDKWPVFLPSEVFLGHGCVAVGLPHPNLYHYNEVSFDVQLQPGAFCPAVFGPTWCTWTKNMLRVGQYVKVRCSPCSVAEAIEQFWEDMRDTEWFKQHPVLSRPAS